MHLHRCVSVAVLVVRDAKQLQAWCGWSYGARSETAKSDVHAQPAQLQSSIRPQKHPTDELLESIQDPALSNGVVYKPQGMLSRFIAPVAHARVDLKPLGCGLEALDICAWTYTASAHCKSQCPALVNQPSREQHGANFPRMLA